MHFDALVMGLINWAGGGAPIDCGDPASVAMGQDVDPSFHAGHAVALPNDENETDPVVTRVRCIGLAIKASSL